MEFMEFIKRTALRMCNRPPEVVQHTMVQVLDVTNHRWYSVLNVEHITFDDSEGPSPVLVIQVTPVP